MRQSYSSEIAGVILLGIWIERYVCPYRRFKLQMFSLNQYNDDDHDDDELVVRYGYNNWQLLAQERRVTETSNEYECQREAGMQSLIKF